MAICFALGIVKCEGAQFKPMPKIEYKPVKYATFYDYEYFGKTMANGQPFNPRHYTCASWDYPLGTWLKVTNPSTGKHVIVEVTDRWGCCTELDLSFDAYVDLLDEYTHLDPGHQYVTTEVVE